MKKYVKSNRLSPQARLALVGFAILYSLAMVGLARVLDACARRDEAFAYAEGYFGACVSEGEVR